MDGNTPHSHPHFDFSERLFSLDSDDSSYQQHADFFNNIQTQERDYYEDLFSADSDSESNSSDSMINHLEFPTTFHFDNLPHMLHDDVDKGNIKLPNGQRGVHPSQISPSDSDTLSNSTSHASDATLVLVDQFSYESPIHEHAQINSELPPMSSFLDEQEIQRLLQGEVHLPAPLLQEKQVTQNEDKIACFNVQNKYDHIMAAELFIQEELSFLAIQEPFSSQHKVAESWKSFRLLELESSRIKCFETPYQVVMYDSWKWGGKILHSFKSEQYGRVTSIAFQFKRQKIGFISIYAPTNAHKMETDDPSKVTMQTSSDIVSKIMKNWSAKDSDIQIVILGDLQETISVSDRDNIGTYRQNPSPSGILQLLEHSHTSIVRKLDGTKEYITRFGTEGARGIDHIMVPSDENMLNWVTNAKVSRDIGATFFPSDHSLLVCSFTRFGMNNNEGGLDKTKHDFRKIFSIKLKQKGKLGETLEFNDNQFKDCEMFQYQKELYNKLQKLTDDNAALTSSYLDDTQERINLLYASLWDSGLNQKTDGKMNKLVDISEDQALNLSYILDSFKKGITRVMELMKLDSTVNANNKAGRTRNNIRKRKGFKMFDNLPIPTKIRYLKHFIMTKSRITKQKLLWIKEHKLRKKCERECRSPDSLWKDINKLIDCKSIIVKADIINSELMNELEERTRHVEAINFEKDEKKKELKLSVSDKEYKKIMRQPSNTLLHVNKKLTSKINFWLSESNCPQTFNSTDNGGNSYDLLQNGKLENWNEKLTYFFEQNPCMENEDKLEDLEVILTDCKNSLKNIYHGLTRIQSKYKKETLTYFLNTNKIEAFTRKILPKGRSAPAAHSVIWDKDINDFRNCVDEVEEMQATSQYHGKWMGNTDAKEVCAFAKIISKGRLGFRGVKLNPERIVTSKDLPSLLPQHEKLPEKIKVDFVKAHGKHTANLFQEPKIEHKELFYPFFLVNRNGEMNDEEKFLKNFWKSLARVPSKARFEGFQMSVVGRLGRRWRRCLLDIVKLILLTRFIPPELRKMARFPIPKPGKVNEYRPISLCNDIYCYINAVITSYTSLGIEKANILHDGMCAYRKGKGCSSLVAIELSFREDCNEHNLPVLQLDEDEEKFFDRIPVEILLAAMRINGFPNQGFLEIKASSMQAKTVEIITAKGITYAKFVCGLEQGNPDSPTISNLVIKLKHDIWQTLSKEAKEILLKNNDSQDGIYKFQKTQFGGAKVLLSRIGYCDDNSKYCCVKDEEDLLFLANYYLQLSGDLSMVTKIGRRSSKCELQFFNISANMALKLKNFWSTAWSFLDDGPIEESVPFKICMKREELQKLYELIGYYDLDSSDKATWDAILHSKAHKHLGLKCTLDGNTNLNCQETIAKIQGRVHQIKLHNMHEDAQSKCINMLCSTMHSFVPLQAQFNCNDLSKLDKETSDLVLKRHGITSTDCRHRLYLPPHLGGKGIISFLDQDLISVTRELEIVSNLSTLEGDAFRTRIQASTEYGDDQDEQFINHAKFSINKLAKFGIFFRDRDDDIINNVLAQLNKTRQFASIGQSSYKDGNYFSLGSGKKGNIKLAYGECIWKILKLWQEQGHTWNDTVLNYAKSLKINTRQLQSCSDGILEKRFHNISSLFSFWEWRNKSFHQTQISAKAKDWTFVDMSKILQSKFPFTYLFLSEEEIKKEASFYYEIQGWPSTVSNLQNSPQITPDNPYNFFHNLFKFIAASKSPVFISTDGAHEIVTLKSGSNVTHTNTTAAFVISIADIKPGESIQSGQWTKRASIPLFSRASKLPTRIGNTPSDIATGELWAFAMAELSLVSNLPRIVTTDSKSTRDLVLELRNLDDYREINRYYIRSITGGVSKFLFGIFQHKICNIKKTDTDIPSSILHPISLATKDACILGKTWVRTNNTEESSSENSTLHWEDSYFDHHPFRSIWKVNSHQLNQDGTKIKENPRYKNLIPNLCTLSTNHHADTSADIIKKFPTEGVTIDIATSNMKYFLTIHGESIDRHTTSALITAFANERVKRLKTKSTQGLIWRWYNDVTISWDELDLHKGWFRCLLGLSRSHTRCLYKNENYRLNCKQQALDSSKDKLFSGLLHTATNQKTIAILSGCKWCHKSLEKGNRSHAFLSCDNDNLKKYRKNMRGLVNSKLIYFFTILGSASSMDTVINVLHKIESGFLCAQRNHTGRLRTPPAHRNNSYISIANLVSKWDGNNLQSLCFKENCFILSEIFGLLPQYQIYSLNDDELGIVDAPWLGLIPSFLDSIMNFTCKNMSNLIADKVSSKAVCIQLTSIWEEIKELIMSQAIGLHRVIGTTGSAFEKQIAKASLLANITNVAPLHSNCTHPIVSSQSTSPSKRKSTPASQSKVTPPSTKRKVTEDHFPSQQPPSPPSKICNGITCGSESRFWYADSSFSPNKIRQNIKQCHRCGRHMTALRKTITTLETMMKSTRDEKAIQKLLQFCTSNPESIQYKYIPFMNMLDIFLQPDMQINKALSTNKKSIPERHKLLCRTIHKCLVHATRQSNIDKIIIEKAHRLAISDSKKKHKALTSSPPSNIIITPSKTNSSSEQVTVSLKIPESIEANGNSWLSGLAITKAMDVIRSRGTPNTFFAHADSTTVIINWTYTQGWDQFGRIFGSERVIHEKLNGTYFLPLFTGAQTGGHWHLVVIHKTSRLCTGWILDSLNGASATSDLHRKIERAFCPGRHRFTWNNVDCRQQTELECGIRVIHSTSTIATALRDGLPIQTGISRASLTSAQLPPYNPALLRQEVALLIEEHRHHMIITLSRRRRQQLQRGTANQQRNKRRKRSKTSEHVIVVLS